MGVIQFIRGRIRKFISRIIRQEIFYEKQQKNRYRLNALSSNAVYNNKKVRIDEQATIVNNRNDKKYITIGDNSWITGQLMTLKHGGEITIGNDCFIGEGSRIWSSTKVSIGNRVLISHNVNIHDNISHPLDSVERHKDFVHVRHIGLQETMDIPEKPIVISDDVWIGFNSTILKGVIIGKGAVIGANTVVTKDVPEMAVVVGNPAKIIKYTT
jgi:acetyltransferase-like isoleucine patch superfamily enzyme